MSQQIAQTVSIQRQFIAPRMRVVRRGRRSHRRLRIMIAPMILFCTLLAQISVRVKLVERGYELEALRSQALKKDTELRQLKLDLAVATRPADISKLAANRAGLGPVDPQRVRAVIGAETAPQKGED